MWKWRCHLLFKPENRLRFCGTNLRSKSTCELLSSSPPPRLFNPSLVSQQSGKMILGSLFVFSALAVSGWTHPTLASIPTKSSSDKFTKSLSSQTNSLTPAEGPQHAFHLTNKAGTQRSSTLMSSDIIDEKHSFWVQAHRRNPQKFLGAEWRIIFQLKPNHWPLHVNNNK